MGWRYPERKMQDGGVVDHEDFNDMLRPVVEELSGRLDEHNFSAVLATELSEEDLAEDLPYAYRYARRSWANGIWDLLDALDTDALQTNIDYIRHNQSWQRVGDARTLTLTRPAKVRIVGSVQFWWGPCLLTKGPRHPTHLSATWKNFADTRWAIRVEGAVYAEAVAGSQDWAEEGRLMEKGYRGAFNAPYLETILELAPGVYTFDMVCQVVLIGGDALLSTSDTKFINYSNFELVVMEMRG